MTAISGSGLAKYLKAEGLLPENCRSVRLAIAANDAIVLRYEVFVDVDDMVKLSRALAKFAEADE
jgi:hypothetical protein